MAPGLVSLKDTKKKDEYPQKVKKDYAGANEVGFWWEPDAKSARRHKSLPFPKA